MALTDHVSAGAAWLAAPVDAEDMLTSEALGGLRTTTPANAVFVAALVLQGDRGAVAPTLTLQGTHCKR